MVEIPPTPAGWYPDPENPKRQRYWDGSSWTTHIHDTQDQYTQAQQALVEQAAPQKRRGWILWASLGAVVLIGISTAGIWGVTQLTSSPRPGAVTGHTESSGSGSNGKVKLSEASFYQRALKNLRATLPEVNVALKQPSTKTGVRASPGYTAAARKLVEQVIADLEKEGNTEFDTLDDAESYAYSTLGSEISDKTGGIIDGGVGTGLATKGFPQDPAVVAAEKKIAAEPVKAGPDGKYWDSAAALAAIVGSKLTSDQNAAGCRDSGPDPKGTETRAFVCLGTPNGWGLITYTPEGMGRVTNPDFVNTARHEIAHKLIYVQCGELAGQTWNDEYGEGVANSYAAIYLGADREELKSSGRADPEYIMNETTDAKARAIHESDLACFDQNKLPAQ